MTSIVGSQQQKVGQMSSKKPRIVMVVDAPDWAFAISAKDMVKYMPWYDFKILKYSDGLKDPAHYLGADLVYLFGYYMIDWIPQDLGINICAGVRARYDLADEGNIDKLLQIKNIHVVSEELSDFCKVIHRNVVYVSHGVDTNFFKQMKKNNDRLTLGWAGNRGNAEKNIGVLESVVGSRNDVSLITAEYGANTLDREQMRDFYNKIDVYVLPSSSEGNSATLLEAMASGLPIIATAVGTWPEIFKKTKGGVMIDSVGELHKAIDEIKTMDLTATGKRNRDLAVKEWSWEIKAKEFKVFFDNALKDKTVDTFSHKWKVMPKGYGDSLTERQFFQEWAVKKYGFMNIEELHKFYAKKRNILEVGIGSGFNLKYISEHTDANITGSDISDVVCDTAKEMFYENDKVSIIRSDLNDIKGKFDLIIADGVLHHTKSTKESLMNLYDNNLEVGGHIYAYIYRKMGPLRELSNDWIREHISGMSETEKVDYCKKITDFGKRLSKIKDKIFVDLDILGLEPNLYTIHDIFYYGVMKCFWNDIFTYEVNNLNNYDWFAPERATRHTDEEVLEWFRKKSCVTKINKSNPNGISLLVEKIDG